MQFLGCLDNASLADAYAACDLLCLLSREEVSQKGILAEGYGIVLVQAGSFSKPVLALRRGGTPDAVLHGETGILLEDDDARVIAFEIERLMGSPGERARLGHNGFERVMSEASWAAARRRAGEMLSAL